MSVNLIFALGALVVVLACITPLIRSEISAAQTAIVALCGLVIIGLSDRDVKNFSCDWSKGCQFERTGAPPEDQIKGIARAEVDSGLLKFGQELESKFREINNAVKQIQVVIQSSPSIGERNLNPAPLPSSAITAPTAASGADNKGTILVYFKDGQEEKANLITNDLRKYGFVSSATNSNLKEIQQWARKSNIGFVQVAVAGDNDALASELRKILSKIVQDNSLAVDTGWAFRASNAQIYLF